MKIITPVLHMSTDYEEAFAEDRGVGEWGTILGWQQNQRHFSGEFLNTSLRNGNGDSTRQENRQEFSGTRSKSARDAPGETQRFLTL